jgi:hypothetical protein
MMKQEYAGNLHDEIARVADARLNQFCIKRNIFL